MDCSIHRSNSLHRKLSIRSPPGHSSGRSHQRTPPHHKAEAKIKVATLQLPNVKAGINHIWKTTYKDTLPESSVKQQYGA
jgi:hypothetical protein